jgi:hypothetical protein
MLERCLWKNGFPQQTGLAFQYCTFFLVADAFKTMKKPPQQAEKDLPISVPHLRVRFAQIRVKLLKATSFRKK